MASTVLVYSVIRKHGVGNGVGANLLKTGEFLCFYSYS